MVSCIVRLALFAVPLVSSPVLSAIIIVPDDQPTVQAAVAVAVAFDVIQVRPGLIPDRVLVIGKTDLVIEGLGGRPVFPPANRKDGFDVRSSARVSIAGFDFQNRKTVVRLTDCSDCTVTDVHATACREGIRAGRSIGVRLEGNQIDGTGKGRGINVDRSPGARIIGNVVSGGLGEGIRVTQSPGTDVLGNTSTGNHHGLVVRDSVQCLVSLNATDDNRAEGVRIDDADHSIVWEGTSNSNGRRGIRIDDSPGIAVVVSGADNNGSDGLWIDDCPSALVQGNAADDNDGYGIRVGDSPPIATIQDLFDDGNTASGNGDGDLRVDP